MQTSSNPNSKLTSVRDSSPAKVPPKKVEEVKKPTVDPKKPEVVKKPEEIKKPVEVKKVEEAKKVETKKVEETKKATTDPK